MTVAKLPIAKNVSEDPVRFVMLPYVVVMVLLERVDTVATLLVRVDTAPRL